MTIKFRSMVFVATLAGILTVGVGAHANSGLENTIKNAFKQAAGEENIEAIQDATECKMPEAVQLAENALKDENVHHQYMAYMNLAAFARDMGNDEEANRLIEKLAGDTKVNTSKKSEQELSKSVDKHLEAIHKKRQEKSGKESC